MSTKQGMHHVVTDEKALKDLTVRLRRAEGQIAGVLRMIEQGRSCDDIVTQLAAVSKAVDRAAFSLIATGLRECIAQGESNADEVAAQMQKLFLTMA